MAKSLLDEKFKSYPDDVKSEAIDFADYLVGKKTKPSTRTPKRGSGKDLFKYVAPDFDEPLEDFREYME